MLRIRGCGTEIIVQCCSCQRIRNEAGNWQDAQEMRLDINKTLFSHSLCPSCLVDLYPEYVSAVGLNL